MFVAFDLMNSVALHRYKSKNFEYLWLHILKVYLYMEKKQKKDHVDLTAPLIFTLNFILLGWIESATQGYG